MKALVEKRIKEQEDASAAFAEANVYSLEEQRQEEGLSEAQKKRLAEEMQQRTGWDDPIYISPITAGVRAMWDTQVYANRRARPKYNRNKERDEESSARKEVRFKVDTNTSNPPKEEEKAKELPGKKGPGWVLGCEVEQAVEPLGIANKFWKQEVRGFTSDSGSIENEYHVFIACRWYQELRVAHQILVTDLHDLFKLPPKQLGLFIMAVDKKRCENIRH
ncbi:unnamed protein product [Calypogeia fissa]